MGSAHDQTQTELRPGALRYVDALIGILREGGVSVVRVHHALHILGSRALGFAHALVDDSSDLEPEATIGAQLVQQRWTWPLAGVTVH